MSNLPYAYPAGGPFWVSPSGSDSTGDGSQGSPWKTITKAQTFIRAGKLNEVQIADIVVNVRAGTYREQVTFGPLDSGFNGHQVRYLSYDGPGLAIVDAGVQITNWTNVSGNIFKASVPNTFSTMYENDIRSDCARLPHRVTTGGYPMARAPYFITQSDANSLTELIYSALDFDPTGWSTSDLQVVGWPGGLWEWLTDQSPVSGVNTTSKTITFPNQEKFNWYQSALGSRYFVQGVQAMQASANPGEWYLDRAGGFLYYVARDGDIHSQNIVIPTATEAVRFTGTSWKNGERVSNITFDGFAVQHTDHVSWYRPGWPVPTAGTVNGPVPNPWLTGSFYAWLAVMPQNQLGAVHLRNTNNVTVTNCHVKNAGMYGVFVDGYGQQNQIINSWVEGVGCSGVRLDGQFPGLGDVVNNNTIQNCRINNIGELSGTGSGVDVAQSGSNLLKNLTIHDGPRKGIWMLAVAGQTDQTTVYTHGNLIDHVLMQNLCQDSGDTGALGFDELSSVFPNLLQNTAQQVIINGANAHPSLRDAAPNGVFCDDESDGTILTNVQVTNTQGNQFRLNNSSNHVLTNTSFLINGSPNGSFNAGLMDTANIGTASGFPYP